MAKTSFAFAIAIAVLVCAAAAAQNNEAAAIDTIVVCPSEFQQCMAPWLKHRQAQGHRIEMISSRGTAGEIREHIKERAAAGKLRFVLLVGDAPVPENGPSRARCTPTFRQAAKVNVAWGGDPDFATDFPYSDLNDDGVPEIAVGRLTADSSTELSRMIQRILAYEQSNDFGRWRSRVSLVAGDGGFGALADTVIETASRKLIDVGIPPSYHTTMTYANWRSPYCPNPDDFQNQCVNRFNEGCVFWVYMGHGLPRQLKPATFPDGSRPLFSCDDCNLLQSRTPPIALFLACFTGAFANREDCLAEELLRTEGGPIAVFSGSNVTMPYGMAWMGRAAMHHFFNEQQSTIGELFLHAKRDAVAGYELPIWSLTNALTLALAPSYVRPKQERLEQIQLFQLFGDPTMRLQHPKAVELSTPEQSKAGERLIVRGACPIDGQATVELVLSRTQVAEQMPARKSYDLSSRGRLNFENAYRSSNNPCAASSSAQVKDGSFITEILVPQHLEGKLLVRVFVTGPDGFALGHRTVEVLSESR